MAKGSPIKGSQQNPSCGETIRSEMPGIGGGAALLKRWRVRATGCVAASGEGPAGLPVSTKSAALTVSPTVASTWCSNTIGQAQWPAPTRSS